MDVLYKTQADLLKGKEKLEQMMQNLEKEKVGDYVDLLADKFIQNCSKKHSFCFQIWALSG